MGKRKITFFQRIGYILETIVVVPLATLIGLMPRFMIRPVSWLFAGLVYALNGRDRKWAYYNLDVIYKDKPLDRKEKKRIIMKLYRNVVKFGIEYMQLGRITAKNYHKYARYINFEAVENAHKSGKGALVLTLHLGNWEYMGSVSAKLGTDLAAVINRQFNPYTDKWLKRIREKQGKIVCYYNEISDTRNVAKHLKRGGVLTLVADQTYYFKPIFVPFFGMNSATADGPARLHLRYGSPIVMGHCYTGDDGRYVFDFEDGVTFEPTGDEAKDCERIMAWVNSKYEGYILAHIDQWFSLLHARWERTTPEQFEELDFDPF